MTFGETYCLLKGIDTLSAVDDEVLEEPYGYIGLVSFFLLAIV
jgi:DMSO/TMAO reductase YedYZ heme-binding membrane subunit